MYIFGIQKIQTNKTWNPDEMSLPCLLGMLLNLTAIIHHELVGERPIPLLGFEVFQVAAIASIAVPTPPKPEAAPTLKFAQEPVTEAWINIYIYS